MTTKDFHKISISIPEVPGIYKFVDESGIILYVGKAKNLKKRLTSYFGQKKNQPFKTRTMVKHSESIDYTVLESEADALLLENTLVKKFQPRYNVMLKDGKSYSYICIKNERFPRVFFTRRLIRDGSTYFGPYTSKHRTKQILEIIGRLFPLRTCTFQLSEENIKKEKFKICLEYHIKNCLGPCEGLEEEQDYIQKIEQIKNILNGHFKPVKDYIQTQMHFHSRHLEFEKANRLKEKLDLLEDYQARSTVVNHRIKSLDVFSIEADDEWAYVNYLKVINGALINTDTVELKKNLNNDKMDLLRFAIHSIREKFESLADELVLPFRVQGLDGELKQTIPQRGDKRKLLDLSQKNIKYFILHKKKQEIARKNKQTSSERILNTMKEDLQMDRIPLHIECFDNSNIQGTHPVASCVVFRNAKPSKKDYRYFHIKTVEGINDFASMEEVVSRRYKRLMTDDQSLPQLIIIDGGKGQLNAAAKSLKKLGILDQVTLIGIAKRLEEIFFPTDPVPLYINKKSESLKLIQQARNEAHRFAVNFHRKNREKSMTKSEMLEIPGLGPRTYEKLIKYFGSFEKVKKAEVAEIVSLVGPGMAKKLLDHFQSIEEAP